MDLVQTPNAYTAWTPPQKSDEAVAESAKSEVMQAQKEFDGDAGAAFVQLATVTSHAGGTSAPATRGSGQAAHSAKPAGEVAPAGQVHKKPGRAISLLSRGQKTKAARRSLSAGELEEGSTAQQAASIVLERYARSLDSAALLRLSRARLST